MQYDVKMTRKAIKGVEKLPLGGMLEAKHR